MDNKCPHCGGTGQARPNILKTLRAMHRPPLDQGAVAAKLGITQSAYSRLEAAAGTPNGIGWKHRRALAELHKVTTEQLTGRAPLPSQKVPRSHRAPDPKSLAKSRRAKIEKAAKQKRRRIS